MFLRSALPAILLPLFAMPLAASAECDARCKVEIMLTKNIGIPQDKPVTLDALRKLGKVKADNLQKRPNPYYPGKYDIVHRLIFDGLSVRAVVTPENRCRSRRLF